MSTGVFGGSWVDEGIFFTIVVQGGLALVFIIILLCLHGGETMSRVLRPSRPHSNKPRFMTRRDTKALFERDENEVAMRVSVRSALQLLLLKYSTHIFLGGFITAACLVIIMGTDTFISSYSFRKDAYDCKGRSNADDCTGSGVCSWNATSSVCSAKQLSGMQELTLLNVTPTHYRSWLIGIFTVAFHIWFGFCLIKLMVEMRVLVFANKTMSVQVTSEARALVNKSGSRTVRFGIVSDSEQTSKFDGTPASLFPASILANANNKTSSEGNDGSSSIEKQIEAFKTLLTKNAREATVLYQAPEELKELLEKENEIIEEIKELDARDKAGETPGCCSSTTLEQKRKELDGVRGEIKKLQSASQKYEVVESTANNNNSNDNEPAGAAAANPLSKLYSPWKVSKSTVGVITFDSSASAAQFLQLLPFVVRQIDIEQVAVTGPASHIVYEHFPVAGESTVGSKIYTVFLVLVYLFLLFFATVVVAFFGSIESLASVPGLGDIFGVVLRDLPTPLFRILQAYLPVIVLAVFQMLIPPFVRYIADSFKFGNVEQREAHAAKYMFFYLFMSAVIFQTALQGGISQLAGLISRASLTDVMNFLVAIFSPKGGYFFALVLSNAVCSQLLSTLCLGNVIGACCLAPREVQESKKLANEKPRVFPFDIASAAWMLMFTIGVLFHSTSPLLVLFVTVFFIATYYSMRTNILDMEDRSSSSNPLVETTLSCEFASSQVRIMLWIHSFATVGTFVVFLFKFLYGAAALTSVVFVINWYLWTVKSNVLDPLLNTQDLAWVDHYDHLTSKNRRKFVEAGETKKKTTSIEEFLPPFTKYEMKKY